jgi:hypothetical protein
MASFVTRFIFVILALISFNPTDAAESVVDSINFGDKRSEDSHNLDSSQSKIVKGALKSPARVIDPPSSEHWRGGRLTFQMAVDPDKPNYFTAKFWGGDIVHEGEHETRLFLFLEGKQIGNRHLGEVGPLDIMGKTPRFPNRFLYKTLPLPRHMTQGKKSVQLAIESQGGIWGYGQTFEKFQHNLRDPSRSIYRCYSHTDPFFEPDKSEAQGKEPRLAVRTENANELMQAVRKRIDDVIRKELRDGYIPKMYALRFLANAGYEPWTVAYHNKQALEKVVQGVDKHYIDYKKDASFIEDEWIGVGPPADGVIVLIDALKSYLDKPIPGTKIKRRQAWAELFAKSRDWHVAHRRAYTNQTMIVDLNIYLCDRAISKLVPKMAWKEKDALRLLHEAAGAKPWSGSWDEKGRPNYAKGNKYLQLTEKGLTRELGFVGGYGEIVGELVLAMFEATKTKKEPKGDPILREQLIKMAKARTVFRYPLPDDDGFRAMRLEGVVGWRDWKYPGPVVYDQMATDSGGPLDIARATEDPELIGYCQQMLADNQFFAAVEETKSRRGFDPLNTLLRVPRNYQWMMKQKRQKHRLPMTEGQPNFVFADPGVGVVAIKQDEHILYCSLYWRARYAINNLARVHHMTPQIERDATVNINSIFADSGEFHTIRDRTNMPFSRNFDNDYKKEGMELATAGQRQPIARVPSSEKDFKPGKENIHAGKAQVYGMSYGPFCIVMNCGNRAQSIPIPKAYQGAKNLETDEVFSKTRLKVQRGQTVVLYLEQKSD